jgi:hypothetical protein
MKFKKYISEKLDLKKKVWTIVPFTSLDEETRHKLWDMYVDTYQGIGLHIEDAKQLTSKYKIAWLIDTDKDPEPDAFIIYKETKYGNKIALMGTDGGKLNKRLLIKKVLKLLKTSGWYCEASHKIADIFKSNNINVIKDIDLIKKVLKKSDIEPFDIDNGIYKRKLGTMGVVKKQLFGIIKKV